MKKKLVIYLLAAAVVLQGIPVTAAVQETEEIVEVQEEGSDQIVMDEEEPLGVVLEENESDSAIRETDKEGLDYILGRPLTEAEIAAQKAMEPELQEMPQEEIEAEPLLDKVDDGIFTRDGAPSYYDLRQNNIITPAKNQGESNMCWTYAAIAAAEASIISNSTSHTADNTDYSEEHLAYFTYNHVNDPLGNTDGDKTVYVKSNLNYRKSGGNPTMAAMTLSQWKGAAVEGTPADAANAYSDDAILTDYYYIAAEKDEMKAAIQKHGPLAATMYYDTNPKTVYLNRDTYAYCYRGNADSTNHAVTIVGWDDSYSADNFTAESNVTDDGAWIIKNSYGEGWGDGGYFYVSYEEPSFKSAVAIDSVPADTYDHNYQYDGTAGVGMASRMSRGYRVANIYQVKGNKGGYEKLEAVGIHTANALGNYKIQIYTNLKDLADPSSGTLAYESGTETLEYMGYHTIPLAKAVRLTEGKYYSIVVTPLMDNSMLTVEMSYTDGSDTYRHTADIQKQQSFINRGSGWRDLAAEKTPLCFRIKGYTTDGKYKITYKLNGGTNNKSNPTTFVNTKAVSLKNPTRKGYSFGGWYADSKFKSKVTSIPKGAVKDYTLYAKWTKVSVGKGKTPVLKNTKARYMNVKYSAVSGAKGYQIVYSTNSKFNKQKYVYVSGRSKNLSGMKKGTTYYVKVRAYKVDSTGKKVYGSYSKVRKLKITK